ncbi:DUF1353 domain-containing protein [Oceanospirillaceae bacterium]|nr:DUF1353 domain-containing protein [Oceanospirillaceae bacterium]
MECISYKQDYKYQLVETYTFEIPIKPKEGVSSPSGFIALTANGLLTIKTGYAWDGPSGPAIDTLNFMRGSLVHDALYQLMREKLLDQNTTRKPADQLLQKMCKADGMSAFRAWWVYNILRIAGRISSGSGDKKPIIKAPKECGTNT